MARVHHYQRYGNDQHETNRCQQVGSVGIPRAPDNGHERAKQDSSQDDFHEGDGRKAEIPFQEARDDHTHNRDAND